MRLQPYWHGCQAPEVSRQKHESSQTFHPARRKYATTVMRGESNLTRSLSDAALAHLIRAEPPPVAPLARIERPRSRGGTAYGVGFRDEVGAFMLATKKLGRRTWSPDGSTGAADIGAHERNIYLMHQYGKSPHEIRDDLLSTRRPQQPLPPLAGASVLVPSAPSSTASSSTIRYASTVHPGGALPPAGPLSVPAGALRHGRGVFEASPMPTAPKTSCGVGPGFSSAAMIQPYFQSGAGGLGASASLPLLGSRSEGAGGGGAGSVGGSSNPAKGPRRLFTADIRPPAPPPRVIMKPPRPTRLEVIGGLQEPGTLRTKARESLLMTETLSRGSLQRRDLTASSRINAEPGLLTPRSPSPVASRQPPGKEGGLSGKSPQKGSAKKEPEWDPRNADWVVKEGQFGPTVGSRAAKIAQAEKQAAAAAAATAAAEALQRRKEAAAAKHRSPRSPRSPIKESPGGSQGVGGGWGKGSPVSIGSSLMVPSAAPVVWHVAVADAPPLKVEERMLVTLEPSALIWTPGLKDWLPLGDLPPPGKMPPEPPGVQEDFKGNEDAFT